MSGILLFVFLLIAAGSIIFFLLRGITRRQFSYLVVFERGVRLDGIPLLIKSGKFRFVAEITAVFSGIRSGIYRFKYQQSDILQYCRRRGLLFAGYGFDKAGEKTTFYIYGNDKKALMKAENFISSGGFSVDSSVIEEDENLELYRRRLPDEKEIYRTYNSILVPCLTIDTSKPLALRFPVSFDDKENRDRFAEAAAGLFQSVLPRGESDADIDITTEVTLAELNRITDNLNDIAGQYGGLLNPWFISGGVTQG